MAQLPAAGYIENASRTEGEQKTAFADQLKGIKQIPGAPSGTAVSTLTISSGSVTPGDGAGGIFLLDTEAAASTDDLTNIVQTNLPEPSILLLGLANAARVVVVKHSAGGAGQISLRTAGDFVLGDTNHWLLLMRSGTTWVEVWRMPENPVHAVLTKTANYTVTVADRNKLIDGTSGTWTLTLLAAATAGKGFLLPVKNSGTGVITIDGNAAEMIDGLTTLALRPNDEIMLVCDGSNWKSIGRYEAGVPYTAFPIGLTLSNNGTDPTNDIDVAAGEISSDDVSYTNRVYLTLPAAITGGQLDATWAAGSAAGKRVSGQTLADGTWHIFLFRRSGGATDWCFSNTLSFTLPDSGTHRRWIGAIVRASGANLGFTQKFNEFILNGATPLQIDEAAQGTAQTKTLQHCLSGVKVWALLNVVYIFNAVNSQLYVSELDKNDEAPSLTSSPLFTTEAYNIGSAAFAAARLRVRTNASAQIRYRATSTDGTIRAALLGWEIAWDV